ncbi:MAG: hypothetical protein SGPRY_014027 [Prymnesium sp.]
MGKVEGMSSWSVLLLLLKDAFSEEKELMGMLVYCRAKPEVLLMLVASGAYGATVTEMVKSMRKVITVVLSFVLYPKLISSKYLIGGLFVLVSLAATHELQRRKGGDVQQEDTSKPTAELVRSTNRMEEAPLAENVSEGEPELEAVGEADGEEAVASELLSRKALA